MREGHMIAQIQLLVELVTPDPFQVIAALIKKLVIEIFPGILQSWRITRSHAAVELDQSFFCDQALQPGAVSFAPGFHAPAFERRDMIAKTDFAVNLVPLLMKKS